MPDAREVTVVIPTRDRWDLLTAHALPSALRQEDVALEVVVVDDGSTDGTAALLAREQDPRVRVVRHESSRGVASARNAGIASARCSWIAFLDDDDLWSPRKLRTQLEVAREQGADFVFAAAVLVDRQKRVLASDVFPAVSELASRLLQGNVVPGGCSNVLVTSELVRSVGGFDERLTYTEDWDLWIRLALAGHAAVCPDVLVAHVEHAGSALSRYRPDVVSEFEYVVGKYPQARTPDSDRAGRLGLLEWLAHEYLDAGRTRDAARAYLEIARETRDAGSLVRAGVAVSGRPGREAARWVRRLVRRSSSTTRGDRRPDAPAWLELYR